MVMVVMRISVVVSVNVRFRFAAEMDVTRLTLDSAT